MNADPSPGARVTWDDDEPDNPVGTVETAPQSELDYVATCSTSWRTHIERDCVWVRWDGSTHGAWTAVEDLRVVEEVNP